MTTVGPTPSEVMAQLTAPGGEFELTPTQHHGVVVNTFAGGASSLTEAFDLVRGRGSRDAVIYADERVSYDGLVASVTRIAAALRSRFDVRRGDRICIAMRNYPEWVLVFWAAQLVGAVVVPLNAWSTGPELRANLTHARPRLVFADAERLRRLEHEYGDRIDGATVIRVRADSGRLASTPLAELIDHDLTWTPVAPPTGDDVATILYTSGTTGEPKGVIGTHLNHVSALRGIQLRAAARTIAARTIAARTSAARTIAGGSPAAVEARALLTFPFFHVAGLAMLYSCVVTGKPMVLMYKWDAVEAVRLIERERITELYGPPVVLRDFLAAAAGSGRDLSSLRLASSGGSVTNPAQVERARRDFAGQVLLSNAYGLTETTGTVVTQAGLEMFDHPDAVGTPIPGTRIRVVDAHGVPVLPGDEGELQVYGSAVSPGYLDDPVATARSFTDGWFRTGDLGTIDDHGRVRLRGRLKDVIIRGGENIACAEVERAIDAHPDVLESAVVGRPDPALGEAVTAVIRPRDGVVLDVDALTAYLRERLAAFKVPSAVLIMSEPLPRTATGKILKRALDVRRVS